MATYVITIGGATKTFQHETMSISATVNGIDTLNAEVISLDGSYRPVLGNEVIVTEDAVRIFGGLVQTVEESGLGGSTTGPISCRISAQDYSSYASRRYVSATLAAGTLKSMLTTLVNDYLDDYGVVLHASQANGPTLAEVTFTEQRANQVLDDLCDLAGYVWNIDYSKNLRAVASGEIACAYDVEDGDGHALGDVTVETTREDTYANRVYVRVTGAGPATSTETFVAADGVTGGGETRFTAKYPASQSINDAYPNQLIIDGTYVSAPIGFGATQLPAGTNWYWDYTVSPAQLVYPTGCGQIFPTGAEVVSITYAIGYPFTVSASDAGEIASVGLVEVIVDLSEAVTIESAEDIAAAELATRTETQRIVRYATQQVGAAPGMTQTIDLAVRDINNSFLITEVQTVNTTGNAVWRYVTAIESTTYQGSWRDTYRAWMGGLGGSGGGGSLSSTGAAGSSAAPPNRAVQFNHNGSLGGSSQLLADPDEDGDTYGHYDLPAVLALKQVGETQDVLALYKTGYPERALTVQMSSSDICYVFGKSAGGFYVYNLAGDLVLASPGHDVEIEATVGDLTLRAGGALVVEDQYGTLGNVYAKRVALTNAQITALPTTPITLIAAPPTGYRIAWIEASVQINNVAGAYTNVNADGYWCLKLGSAEVSQYLANQTGDYTYVTDLLTGADKNTVQLRPWLRSEVDQVDGWGPLPAVYGDVFAATALSLYADNNGAGDYTGGHASNSGVVSVTYRIEAAL